MKNKKRHKFKKKNKAKKPRNFITMYACLRKAGPMRDKKKERAKKLCREKPENE